MLNEENERIKEKLEFFLDEGVMVHIKLRDKTFLNGKILKVIREGVYWMEERKMGEVFVFLKDVYSVGEYQEEEVVEE